MITKINVDGFKSLNGFELDIHSGLNILVGPNGCGKTNIILFFEFLSKLTSEDLHNAVTKVGGAGTIFKKIGEKEYNKFIACTINGCKKVEKEYIKYQYSFKIGISFDKDFLFFEEQEFKSKIVKNFTTETNFEEWDLILKQDVGDASKTKVKLEKINLDHYKPRFLPNKKKDAEEIKDICAEYLKEFKPSTVSLIQASFMLGEQNWNILHDLRSGETFNIVPSKVKQPEDSANPAGIQKDGSGLANTLYAMKKSRSQYNMGYPFFMYPGGELYDKETLKKIIENVKLANPSILNIDVSNDQFNNQLIIKVFIKGKDDTTVLPLSAMSDGTIKWITLITAILTSREIFSIEEPENFLHPWMQAEIVNIMRNTFNTKNEESFVLMTTHSETLLNYSKPNELIVISIKDGNTIAKRISNAELINEEIKNTGFGLGYYYVSNALDNE